jgi:hypothetical protein
MARSPCGRHGRYLLDTSYVQGDRVLDMLTAGEIATFVRDGFVPVRGAVPRPVAEACADLIWAGLETQGVKRSDPASWTSPVVRIDSPDGQPLAEAAAAQPLWEAYDQLIGPDRWQKLRSMGGTVPVRFPHPDDPKDAGWHIETSFWAGSEPHGNVWSGSHWHTNVRSRDRGLLALFLFSDVGPDDAPTRVRVGSHADAARVLAPAGDIGLDLDTASPQVEAASANRPVSYATGAAGDVYLCHPFLVHAASWPHRGTTPRIITQPGIPLLEPFRLDHRGSAYPVEAAIMDALEGQPVGGGL